MNRLPLSGALALALLAGACGEDRASDAPLAVSAIGGPARAGDPSAALLDPPQRVLLDAVAQGLVRFDAAGQIVPALAERWIVIDDGRSYIFRLREAQWPGGDPVTAEQVVRVLRRAAAANSRNALAPFLAVVDEIVEMTPQVIEVRLKRPRPDLLKLFAQPELAVFNREGGGSGPFRMAAERDGAVLLRPATDLAAAGGAPPTSRDGIRLRGERAARAIARLLWGNADLVLGGSFADWPLLGIAGVDPETVQVDPAVGLFGLAIVEREGFLADAANRAALAMAIDRAALVQAIRPEWGPVETLLPERIDSAAPPTIPSWGPLPLDARRENARARVRDWRRTHAEPLVVRVALPSGPGATLAWGQIAAAFLAIGIEPHRVALDDSADLRLVDAVAPYDSARWYLATACRPCGDEAAALVEAARDAPTLEERARRLAEADAALTADSAYIPIAQPLRWSIVTTRITGWQGNTRAWHPLNHLRNETE